MDDSLVKDECCFFGCLVCTKVSLFTIKIDLCFVPVPSLGHSMIPTGVSSRQLSFLGTHPPQKQATRGSRWCARCSLREPRLNSIEVNRLCRLWWNWTQGLRSGILTPRRWMSCGYTRHGTQVKVLYFLRAIQVQVER